MKKQTLGGERLGGGRKMKMEMRGFERSTHDLSEVFRSTMSPGTLVPFYCIPALPGDTMDIELNADVMTNATLGPCFGSMKLHLDVFIAPMRLYMRDLYINKLGIGLNMSQVLLPQLRVEGNVPVTTRDINNQHVNPSCLLKYLGISGTGYKSTMPNDRRFNAIPYLAYWDIYKQYYANKQEPTGAVIHNSPQPVTPTITSCQPANCFPTTAIPVSPAAINLIAYTFVEGSTITINFTALAANTQLEQIVFDIGGGFTLSASQLCRDWEIDLINNRWIGSNFIQNNVTIGRIKALTTVEGNPVAPRLVRFPLANIDEMRNLILAQLSGSPLIIDNNTTLQPYNLPFQFFQTAAGPPVVNNYSMMFTQQSLALRTYASDIFNNWLDTTTIDGGTGINEVTKVNVVGNKFTIDELNLAKKVYNMLNRIAVSGGTYEDWLDAVYDNQKVRSVSTPMYMGGALRNIVFQEVVSTGGSEPLGTLGGKGRMGDMRKGGNITIKVDEPSYIIGIVSIVPNIDYSQGNSWDSNIKTMNDWHKPDLDEIGFQNLITDQMAWFDTLNVSATNQTFRSAGKTPAWINYMTSYNKVYGNFAEQTQQMFMTLNRRYDWNVVGGQTRIADLTTYIDPMKFNHIFADTRIDAMNFWVQIAIRNTARRKMSAKIIPNL